MVDALLSHAIHIIIPLSLPGLEFVFEFVLIDHIQTLISVVEVTSVGHKVVSIILNLALRRILTH